MGLNLAKTPLLAVLYASIATFAALLLPYSPIYTEAVAQSQWVMPLYGHLLLIGYGLWVSLIAALVFSTIRVNAVNIILLAVSFIGLQWVAPNLYPLMFGHPSSAMTGMDMLFFILSNGLVTIIILVLCKMLLRPPEVKETPKVKLKIVRLIVWALVLPVIFMVLYFITWYFFAWRHLPVREFFGFADAEDNGFMFFLIDTLLYNIRMVPFALLQGFVYMALAFPLLLKLAHKHVMYIAMTITLFLSAVLWQLMPSAVMPPEVRMAQLLQYGVQLFAYGALCGVFLPGVLQKTGAAAAHPATEAEQPDAKGTKGVKGKVPAKAAPVKAPATAAPAKVGVKK